MAEVRDELEVALRPRSKFRLQAEIEIQTAHGHLIR